jgi:predicted phosphodiesterase
LIKDFNISIVISGHTHIPHIKNEHGFLHINPGSLKDKTYVIGNYDSKNKEFKFKIKNII